MVVVGEKRTEHAVNKAGSKDFIVARTAFAFEEPAGETSVRREFFFVLNLEWHEVNTLAGFLSRHD